MRISDQKLRADRLVFYAKDVDRLDNELDGFLELAGARCALLHSYGVQSRKSRAGKCRMIAYLNQATPPVRYHPETSTELVIVSIAALWEALRDGVYRFLPDILTEDRRATTEERLRWLLCHFTINDVTP